MHALVLEGVDKHLERLAAATAVALEELAGKGDAQDRLTLGFCEVKRLELLLEAFLRACERQSLADSVSEGAVVEHSLQQRLRHAVSPEASP